MTDERLISQLLARWEEAHAQGRTLSAVDLCGTHPRLLEEVQRQIEALKAFDDALPAHGTENTSPRAAMSPSADAQTLVTQTARPSAAPPEVSGYELLGILGRGGMGVVYKARQVKLDRLVALKMILAGSHAGPQELARFRAEAEAVARLQHPNIVQIHEVGEQEGLPFFSLELVEGGSLDRKTAGTPLPARQAARLVETLARTVHYAHQRGVVHRDLKPANVLLTADGTPKVTDFGLAKRLDGGKGRTQTGAVLGTPSYMAPEQAAARASEVGPAADVYALGAILYDLLTGRPPFLAASPWETISQVVAQEPVPPRQLQPKVPRDLETICLKCLRKEPRKRYGSAEALAEDLRRFLHGEPVQARRTPAWERAWKWVRRKPAAALGLVSAVLLLLGAVTGTLVYMAQQARWAQQEYKAHADFLDLQARAESATRQGEQEVAAEHWKEAEVALTRTLATVGAEPRLAELADRANRSLAELKARQQARDRLAAFWGCRDDALFHGSELTGQGVTANLRATRAVTRTGLDLFGVGDEGEGPPLTSAPYFRDQEKQEILTACYELLLLRAEAVARPLSAEEDPRAQARQALRILDRAHRLLGRATQAYHLQRASCLARLGDDAGAAAERAHGEDPGLRPAAALDHFLMGKLLLNGEGARRHDLTRAIGYFQSALDLQPGHFWAQFFLASAHLRSGRPDLAEARLTSCVDRKPDFPWVYILRGFVRNELREFAAAEVDFRKAETLHAGPDADYILRVNRGAMRFRQGRLSEAAAELEQAVRLNPGQIMAHVNLAQVYQKQEKFEEAAGQFDEAIRLQPGLAPLYRSRAWLHLEQKELEAALTDFKEAIRLSPPQDPSLAADHTDRGRILHYQKRHDESLQAYNAALAAAPDHAPALRWKGELLLELGRYPEALAALNGYFRQGKPSAEIHRARGLVRARLGDYAGAIDDYSRALELKSGSAKTEAELYSQRGWTYVICNSPKIAERDFEEALRLDPDNSDAYTGRGFVRVRLGQDGSAIADAEQALRLGPENARTVYSAARIFAQAAGRSEPRAVASGRPASDARSWYRFRAVELLRQALALSPEGQRSRFWEEVVEPDTALNPIRALQDFRRLEAEYRRLLR